MNVADWITLYGHAWETADEELLLSLFTEDATYRSSPFREPYRGQAEIRAYWQRATGTQSKTRIRLGAPILDGDRAVVEWWATMLDAGKAVTLPGCLLLRFAKDGRCWMLYEYWNVEEGHLEPFDGWGAG